MAENYQPLSAANEAAPPPPPVVAAPPPLPAPDPSPAVDVAPPPPPPAKKPAKQLPLARKNNNINQKKPQTRQKFNNNKPPPISSSLAPDLDNNNFSSNANADAAEIGNEEKSQGNYPVDDYENSSSIDNSSKTKNVRFYCLISSGIMGGFFAVASIALAIAVFSRG